MKKFLIPICCAVLTALLPAADTTAEARVADAALAAGDYANAVSGYRNAMKEADQDNDADAWAVNAVKLGNTCLLSGDLDAAREVYAEFRRRNPLRSAGTLPGNLLAAEGKYAEADRKLGALAASDPSLADEARFCQGMARTRAGNFAGAYAIFSKLGAGKGRWAEAGRCEAVYALIRQRRFADALAELGAIPAAERNEQWNLLRFMAEAFSGKTEGFKKEYSAFMSKAAHYPQLRLIELLSTVAQAAVNKSDTDFAVQCLHGALDLTADELGRRELVRRLINVYAPNFPERAKAEALRYAKDFPSAPDRGGILINVGRILTAKGLPPQAWEVFSSVAKDRSFAMADRLAAAAEATAVAEKLPSADPVEFYTMLGRESRTAGARAEWQLRHAAYLERRGDRAGALRKYREALRTAPAAQRETMHVALLNYFLRIGDEAGVRKEADFLCGSAKPAHRAAAQFELGKLAAKAGNYDEAGKFFREAAVPVWKHQADAEFQAARMSLWLRQYAAAADGFGRFARKRPDSPLAPEALYHAAAALRAAGKTAEVPAIIQQLENKYAQSQAWAYFVLDRAAQSAAGGKLTEAIAELERFEKKFAGTPAGTEIALQKAVYMDRNGRTDDSVKAFRALLERKDLAAPTAAECAWQLGEILFRQGRYAEAKEMFLRSAGLNGGTVFADAAVGRAVDCDLIRSASLDAAKLREVTDRCEKLANETRHPDIKLQALYKLGQCRESAGEYSKAVEAYERTLYCAAEMQTRGIAPDRQWCVRAADAALELLIRQRQHLTGAWSLGCRVIDLLNRLRLPGVSGADKWNRFVEQFNATRRK